MKRILGDVSVKDFDGCLKKIVELLEHKQLGHYYLHQIGQLLHEVPSSPLSKKWLKDLSYRFVWERAEEHFKKTKQLWYNELSWPFQICVLEMGGLNNQKLRQRWLKKFSGFYTENKLTEHIDELDLSNAIKKRKVMLIRLQVKHLDLLTEEVNCNHPRLNLSLCPPETAFFMRPLIKEYFDSQETIFAMDFKPSTMVDQTKKRVFYLARPGKSHGNDLYMSVWDVSANSGNEPNTYWIFQYNLPNE